MKLHILRVLPIILIFPCMFSCSRKKQQKEEPKPVVSQRDSVLLDADKKRNAWAQQLQAMTVKQLTDQLSKESVKGLEPFNSMAYKELISRKSVAIDTIQNAVIKNANRSSLLSLLAVRKLSQPVYQKLDAQVKASVYVDALRSAKTFNTFGLPHAKWEEAAQAIIEAGPVTTRGLEALLTDKRPAPMWGSEDYMEYKLYNYRVKDYAYALIIASQKGKLQLPKDSDERDKMIDALSKGKQ
ncbi:hypothetical protein [Mucilaginibacter flavidus]|uniref:hypothetical protein n=1 Tax=Mucilaginibacter flavidus TaxID=2949309 RepID=UPI002093B4FA|nr:hypothetical protein [Mucilaginibacter flavidus]MCO5949093.1 hypothetical protein [Mucilaginibacter flavidus]